ncbi:phosphatidylinositol-specific phospholipase C domain-containing protein [Vitiosangium sp. GDMCC 1.1324]|uniref:phosphatidylinositol-specific phospholipase C domain-containing protein n=1 Tax=Vitiosangium sp. (strain GDMCC 1.1324) TaxID=2138576 RepID=UPI000D3796FD|nr:phosphatidylinositol-specific phospholipase C domain-containing protein [Vitiosangium sp. GDMCC 1.1324]PTL80278.1 hypothetical protein DAT35_30275 [Vitiosangium sp. GDMCC 1.1324]
MASQKAQWMELMADSLGPRRLEDLVLPGTHNSGTYSLSADDDFSPDQVEFPWSAVLNKSGLSLTETRKLFARWGKAQGMNLPEQLEQGIRYLHFRVAHRKGGFYACEGLYGADLGKVLPDVQTFLTNHPREIVILDFERFYEMETFAHHALVLLLQSTFPRQLAPRSLGTDVTLNELWAHGKRVIVAYGNSEMVDAYPELWARSSKEAAPLVSPNPHTQSKGELEKKLTGYLAQRSPESFLVLQGVLTPDEGMICAGLTSEVGAAVDTVTGWFGADTDVEQPSSLREVAREVSPRVAAWVRNEWADEPVNVVMVDWAEDSSLVDVALMRNGTPDPWSPQVNITERNQAETSDMPAAVVYGNRLHVAYRGRESSNLYVCTSDGVNWSAQNHITDKNGAKSSHGPSLAVFNGRLYMAYRGEDSSNLYCCSFDGSTWSAQTRITDKNGARTSDTPALASFNGALHLVFRGDGSSKLYTCTFDGTSWSRQQCLTDVNGAKAGSAPTLAMHADRMYLAWKGESLTNLWVCSFDGSNWSAQTQLTALNGAKTSETPALASLGDRLYAIYRGEGSSTLWSCSLEAGQWGFQNDVTGVNGAKTSKAPALAVLGNALHLFFRGESSATLRACSMSPST